MNRDEVFPRWARELERYLPVKSLYFLHDNIHDRYPFPHRETKIEIPGLAGNADLVRELGRDPDRFRVEGDTVTLSGILYRAERDLLLERAGTNGPQQKAIAALYADSRDFAPFASPAEVTWTRIGLNDWLYSFLATQGYSVVTYFDIADGFSFPDGNVDMRKIFAKLATAREDRIATEDEVRAQAPRAGAGQRTPASLSVVPETALTQIRAALRNSEIPVAVVIHFSSRLVSNPSSLTPDENRTLVHLMKAAEEAATSWTDERLRRNLLLLVCERLNDLPPWVYLGNPQAKQLQIDLPDQHWRRLFFATNRNRFHGSEALTDAAELGKTGRVFCDMTSGMSGIDMENIRDLSINERLDCRGMKGIVERYKFGITESEWDRIERRKLETAGDKLGERVKGQPQAISHVLDIIKRAATGLSGIQQSSSSNRPRGILFFAGPTGVGKTEMAKAMAELLFGDEKKCIRFDMSEYAAEHADQRLLGAPPGYVGYEEGGQLTNALRQSPFCVLLFDEIEKAHPRILDKFLQILDDGRLTDGRGETVYFSEAIIIFTSNLGVKTSGPDGRLTDNTTPDMSYTEVRDRMREAIREFFGNHINRPELYNRFGENFVVFDYIREPIVREIVSRILGNFCERLARDRHVTVAFGAEVTAFLTARSMDNRENGGRGIGNIAERFLVNPFARWLFDNEVGAGETIEVRAIRETADGQVEVEAVRS